MVHGDDLTPRSRDTALQQGVLLQALERGRLDAAWT